MCFRFTFFSGGASCESAYNHAYVRFYPRDEYVHGDVNRSHLRLFHQALIPVQVM